MTPDWLYFRREYPDRAYNTSSKVRTRCAIQDPPGRTGSGIRPLACLPSTSGVTVAAIRVHRFRPRIERECYRYLTQWMIDRAACRAFPEHFGRTEDQPSGT